MEPVETKRCSKCKFSLPRIAFGIARTRHGGLQAYCKTCQHQHYLRRYAEKKELISAQNDAYRLANPERTAARKRRYFEEHREDYNRNLRAWRKKNWEQHYVNDILSRRSKARGARQVKFTHGEWLEIMTEYGYKCAYCHSTSKLTVDHIVPLSKGGQHVRENIAPACQPCNSRKSNHT